MNKVQINSLTDCVTLPTGNSERHLTLISVVITNRTAQFDTNSCAFYPHSYITVITSIYSINGLLFLTHAKRILRKLWTELLCIK